MTSVVITDPGGQLAELRHHITTPLTHEDAVAARRAIGQLRRALGLEGIPRAQPRRDAIRHVLEQHGPLPLRGIRKHLDDTNGSTISTALAAMAATGDVIADGPARGVWRTWRLPHQTAPPTRPPAPAGPGKGSRGTTAGRANRALVADAIRQLGPSTVPELDRHLDMARSTITGHLAAMVQAGDLRKGGPLRDRRYRLPHQEAPAEEPRPQRDQARPRLIPAAPPPVAATPRKSTKPAGPPAPLAQPRAAAPGRPAENVLLDVIARTPRAVTVDELTELGLTDHATTRAALAALHRRGRIDLTPSGAWRWSKPDPAMRPTGAPL